MRRIALAVAGALALTGCASTSGTQVAAAPTTSVSGSVETLHHGSLTARGVSASQSAFGLALLSKLCGTGGPNTLLSPASAGDALGLLDAASAGTSAGGMAHLLHLPVWGPAVVAAVHDHHSALAKLGTGTSDTLRTSNHVWPAAGTSPSEHYLDDVRTAYGAEVRTLDYAHHAKQSTAAINKQVSKDTDGLIPQLLDQTLPPSTTATLTNAMVLNAKWQSPFSADTSRTPFRTASGKVVQVTQMESGAAADYTSTDGWQAAEIGYVSGTMDAVAILPPASAKACTLPTAKQLATLAGAPSAQTSVTLPRLRLRQTLGLSKPLEDLGLPVTGFPGLGGDFAVNEVIQKNVMAVDELGTEAASATAVTLATAPEPPAKHLSFDRPFLLLLEDTGTQTPLFLASVGNPDAS